MLTNNGGLFQAKGFAAEYDNPKIYLTLTPTTDVKLEKAGSDLKGENIFFILFVGCPARFCLLCRALTHRCICVLRITVFNCG